jgi:hypothetical protein
MSSSSSTSGNRDYLRRIHQAGGMPTEQDYRHHRRLAAQPRTGPLDSTPAAVSAAVRFTAPLSRRGEMAVAPYNSGILAGGIHFEYQNAPAEISAKVARITDIAQRHNVPIKAAALQFSLAHPATAAVIPGASKPERIAEDYAALNTTIPDEFWHEMRDHHLVAANAPLPIDR